MFMQFVIVCYLFSSVFGLFVLVWWSFQDLIGLIWISEQRQQQLHELRIENWQILILFT